MFKYRLPLCTLRFSTKSVIDSCQTRRDRSTGYSLSGAGQQEVPVACQDGKGAEDPTPAYYAAFAGANNSVKVWAWSGPADCSNACKETGGTLSFALTS